MQGSVSYAEPGPLTTIDGVDPVILEGLPPDPIGICRVVPGLVIHPLEAERLGMGPERFAEKQIRSAEDILHAVLGLDPAPLHVSRAAQRRVIGTCRNFVVLSCALLRRAGIPARARCGFGMYFEPGRGLDHWIAEYWRDDEDRWIQVDAQNLLGSWVARPDDLQPGEFLTGGEAWIAYRAGQVDAGAFGVYGTENFGPGEIRGNAIRDLAALNKAEMLPWDEWGRMTASYEGQTGADYDELIDTVAAVCAEADPSAVAELYASHDLQVPSALIC